MNKKPRVREEWEMRDDARTLARAEEIKADKERLSDALKMAKQIAKEDLARMNGMLKVAGKQQPKAPKTTPQEQMFNRRGYNNPASLGRLF